MRHAFTHNGKTFIYDYSCLVVEQIEVATQVYMLAQHQAQNPPQTVRDLKMSGAANIESTALSFLLCKQSADGGLEPFNRTLVDHAEDFIRSLPPDDWKRLQECKADFFSRAGIVDVGLITPYLPLLQKLVVASSLARTTQQSVPAEPGSSVTMNDGSTLESQADAS